MDRILIQNQVQKEKQESIYLFVLYLVQRAITNPLLSFLSQMNSWSRLKLFASMFYLLCYSFNVTPILINFVTDFCKRIRDLGGNYMLCQHRFLFTPNTNEINTFGKASFMHINNVLNGGRIMLQYTLLRSSRKGP
jgi:hypothetical protein